MEPPAELVASGGVPISGRPRMLVVGLALAALGGISATTATAAEPHRLAALAGFVLPLLPLLLGAGMMSTQPGRAESLLLFGVPLAIALSALANPAAPFDPIVFAVGSVVLIAYLVLAARALNEGKSTAANAVALDRPSEPIPPRFHRRLRLYRVFQIAAALAFVVPLAVAIGSVAAGSPTSPLVLFATAGLLGALACRAFFVDTLERHLQRDPQLARTLSRLRRHARRARPAPMFYAAAVIALVAMTLFAARRLLGFVVPEAGA